MGMYKKICKKYSIIHNDWVMWHLFQETRVSNLNNVDNKQQGGNIKKEKYRISLNNVVPYITSSLE